MTTASADILGTIGTYYSDKLRHHGATVAGVDWNSQQAQHTRFEQFLHLIDSGTEFTINDLGCGYGALLPFLGDHNCRFRYFGYDVAPEMIDRAVCLHGDSVAWRFSSDVQDMGLADYTVASGIFNVKLATSNDDWFEYMKETVDMVAANSKRGFAFNALPALVDAQGQRSDLYYADSGFWCDYCLRSFSRETALLQNYGLFDFTILVRL